MTSIDELHQETIEEVAKTKTEARQLEGRKWVVSIDNEGTGLHGTIARLESPTFSFYNELFAKRISRCLNACTGLSDEEVQTIADAKHKIDRDEMQRTLAARNAVDDVGIPTEALENGIIGEMVDFLHGLRTQVLMTESRIQPGPGTIEQPQQERERLTMLADRADELLDQLKDGEA